MGRPDRQYFSVCMINRSDAGPIISRFHLRFPYCHQNLCSLHLVFSSLLSSRLLPSLHYFSGLISWIDSVWFKCTVRGPKAIPSLQPISISQRWAINLKDVVLFITVILRNEEALRIREVFMSQGQINCLTFCQSYTTQLSYELYYCI